MTKEFIDRRTAVELMGAGLGMGALTALTPNAVLATEASQSADGETTASASDSANTEVDISALAPQPITEAGEMGLTTLSVEEINNRRHELVDATTGFTREDGTIVSDAHAKLRTLINTYGIGTGNGPEDSIDYLTMLFTEEDAENYLKMPFGRVFSAADFAETAGLEEDECTTICDDLASRGLLYRAVRGGEVFYHHIPNVIGSFEYSINDFFKEGWAPTFLNSWLMPTMSQNTMLSAGEPIMYAIPCSDEIVADKKVLALDDYKKIVDRYDTIVVIPCQCRSLFMALNGVTEQFGPDELPDAMSPVCGHPVETCMGFGEEAEFALWQGRGRQIDKEEALAILQRSVDAGMIIQNMTTADSEFLCSCHGECCGILASYIAVGPEVAAASTAFKFTSNYILEYDRDACIQCGACVQRCPMTAITMDDTNHPQVNALCMRCGQCGMVCPVGARKLTAKPAEERPARPDNLLGDLNRMAGWRMENGDLRADK